MSNYSRRRRGYYGPIDPTPVSNFAAQFALVIAMLVVITCIIAIAANSWPAPAVTDFQIRSRI